MGKFIDLIGQKFGRLSVIKRSNKKGCRGRPMWECCCDCGSYVVVLGDGLRSGGSKSCGCLGRENCSKALTN